MTTPPPEQTPLRAAIVLALIKLNIPTRDETVDDLLALHHQRIQSLIDRLPEKDNMTPDKSAWYHGAKRHNDVIDEVRHLLESELKK